MDYRQEYDQAARRLHEEWVRKSGIDDPFLALCQTDTEIIQTHDRLPLPKDGSQWGNWRFNANNLTLTYVPLAREFNLEERNIFGLVMHFCAKSWMTAEDAGNLIFALSDLIYGNWADEGLRNDGLKQLRQRLSKARPA